MITYILFIFLVILHILVLFILYFHTINSRYLFVADSSLQIYIYIYISRSTYIHKQINNANFKIHILYIAVTVAEIFATNEADSCFTLKDLHQREFFALP